MPSNTRSARIWSGGNTGKVRLGEESGITADVPFGHTAWRERLPHDVQAERRETRLARGQIDYSVMSPLLMASMVERQRNRRRGFGATILTGGLGLDETGASQRKTLLGA